MLESFGITVDCAEAEIDVLADFWAAALGYEKLLPFWLVDPGGVRPRLFFQAVPEAKPGKNRWHLDLYVEHLDGLAAEVERLRALGASELRHVDEEVFGFTNTFTAMRDPCGNEICVCAPHVPVASEAD